MRETRVIRPIDRQMVLDILGEIFRGAEKQLFSGFHSHDEEVAAKAIDAMNCALYDMLSQSTPPSKGDE